MIRYYVVILFPLALIFSACGGPPAQNPLLDEANTAFEEAERDSMIVLNAPVALKEAEEALETSRELWEAKADKVYVDHYAYLAKQKTAIARETARLNSAQHEIERAESERQRVLLDVRRRDAMRAEERAQRALDEAQRERTAAGRQQNRRVEVIISDEEGMITDRGD